MLQKLLDFLAACEVDGNPAQINEWLIATTVFGRPKEFDSSTDTTVRTAVYRLRTKLREYYAESGKNDAVLIEIPKGHHVLVFSKRTADDFDLTPFEPESGDAPSFTEHVQADVAGPAHPPRTRLWFLLAASAIIVVLALYLTLGRRSDLAPRTQNLTARFWHAFAGSNRSVIVAYSNAELLQTETRDLMRYDAGAVDDRGATVDGALAARSVATPELLRGHNVFYEDGYTGTGEVQSVFALTRLLTQLGFDLSVRRVRLLTPDDFKNHDVVLLGSPLENRALSDLRLSLDYAFELPLHAMWGGRIMDKRNPATAYSIERDPKTKALQSDFGLLAVLPSLTPEHHIMIMGGLTTSGTEGTAEFISSEAGVADLTRSLKLNLTHPLPSFEAVTEIRVVRGLDPVNVKLLHARFPQR